MKQNFVTLRSWLFDLKLLRLVNVNFESFAQLFSSRNRKPPLVSYIFLPLFIFRFGRRGLQFLQLMKSLRLDPSSSAGSSNLPINLLILAHPKDIVMLPFVITSTIERSLNPIVQVIVISPGESLVQIRSSITNLIDLHSNISFYFYADHEILGVELYHRMQNDFPNRFGWIVQQFLTIAYVIKSDSHGVLQVDADTVNLSPTIWLHKDGKQNLQCSTEYHFPYYAVIKRLLGLRRVPKESHVCHQMLFQPKLTRRYLAKLGKLDILTLYEEFMRLSKDFADQESRFCAKYELYAYLLLENNPELIIKSKFSNLSISRRRFLSDSDAVISENLDKFSSISAHSYMDK